MVPPTDQQFETGAISDRTADPAKRLVRQIAKPGVTCLLPPVAAKQASV